MPFAPFTLGKMRLDPSVRTSGDLTGSFRAAGILFQVARNGGFAGSGPVNGFRGPESASLDAHAEKKA